MKKINIKLAVLIMMIACILLLVLTLRILEKKSINTLECSELSVMETNNDKCNDEDLIIENNSFEIVDDNFIPDNWIMSDPLQDYYIIDSTDNEYECYDGNYCLDVNMPYYNDIYSSMDAVQGEKKIMFNYYAVDPDSTLKLEIIQKDMEDNVIDTHEENIEIIEYNIWQEIEFDFNVLDNAEKVEIHFSTNNDNEIYGENVLIDNIHVGNTPVYDMTTDVEYDDGYVYVNSVIKLVKGIPEEIEYKLLTDGNIKYNYTYVNGIEENNEDIIYSNEIDDKTYEEKSEIVINLNSKVTSMEVETVFSINTATEENIEIKTGSSIKYSDYEASESKNIFLNIGGTSKMITSQYVSDEENNGYASSNEILNYTIVLDNTNSNIFESGVEIIIDNEGDVNLGLFIIDSIKITDNSGNEVAQDRYSFNGTTKTLTFDFIPPKEKYTINYSMKANDYILENKEEIINTISISSLNKDSADIIKTSIPIDLNSLTLEVNSTMYKNQSNKYDLVIDVKAGSQDFTNFHIWVADSQKNYLSQLDSSDINIYDSVKGNLIENEDYIFDGNTIIINEIKANEQVKIKISFNLSPSEISENLSIAWSIESGKTIWQLIEVNES